MFEQNEIAALIPAAGSGTRIGIPKVKLKSGSESFLSLIVKKIRHALIEDIVCVVNQETYEWAQQTVNDITYITNPNPEDGMISSIYYGIQELKNYNSILIHPVDHPYIYTHTIMRMVMKARRNPDSVIKPFYNNKHGHPIIIPNKLIECINNDFAKGGLNEIIKSSGISQIYIPVSDPNILRNVNSTEDLNK